MVRRQVNRGSLTRLKAHFDSLCDGHQQVAEQYEQQYHSERDFNGLSTISKSPLRHPILPKSAIRHTHQQFSVAVK